MGRWRLIIMRYWRELKWSTSQSLASNDVGLGEAWRIGTVGFKGARLFPSHQHCFRNAQAASQKKKKKILMGAILSKNKFSWRSFPLTFPSGTKRDTCENVSRQGMSQPNQRRHLSPFTFLRPSSHPNICPRASPLDWQVKYGSGNGSPLALTCRKGAKAWQSGTGAFPPSS